MPLGNSGYLLPSSPANEEQFQWLATSIRKYGGDAAVVRVESIDNVSTPQLVGRFAEARAKDYQELIHEIEKFASRSEHDRGIGRLSRLRNRFQEIVEVDFFGSPLQKRVAELLETADGRRDARPKRRAPVVNRQDYRNRVWVTRPRPGVDRSASAWLICSIKGKVKKKMSPRLEFFYFRSPLN